MEKPNIDQYIVVPEPYCREAYLLGRLVALMDTIQYAYHGRDVPNGNPYEMAIFSPARYLLNYAKKFNVYEAKIKREQKLWAYHYTGMARKILSQLSLAGSSERQGPPPFWLKSYIPLPVSEKLAMLQGMYQQAQYQNDRKEYLRHIKKTNETEQANEAE